MVAGGGACLAGARACAGARLAGALLPGGAWLSGGRATPGGGACPGPALPPPVACRVRAGFLGGAFLIFVGRCAADDGEGGEAAPCKAGDSGITAGPAAACGAWERADALVAKMLTCWDTRMQASSSMTTVTPRLTLGSVRPS